MQQQLAEIRERAMASVIAGLINEHEPLLRAEAEGPALAVRERGSNGPAFRISIDCEAPHQPKAMASSARSAR